MKIGESKEDYLEAAYVLKRQKGYVRNSMLSDYLNYSKASVSVAVRGLLADGYVIKDRYGSIELTEEGRKIAKKIYARHVLLEEFLRRIGVSSETANHDACRMEHTISEESYKKDSRIGTEDEGREYVKRRNEINELNQKQERRWRDFTAFSALKMK